MGGGWATWQGATTATTGIIALQKALVSTTLQTYYATSTNILPRPPNTKTKKNINTHNIIMSIIYQQNRNKAGRETSSQRQFMVSTSKTTCHPRDPLTDSPSGETHQKLSNMGIDSAAHKTQNTTGRLNSRFAVYARQTPRSNHLTHQKQSRTSHFAPRQFLHIKQKCKILPLPLITDERTSLTSQS